MAAMPEKDVVLAHDVERGGDEKARRSSLRNSFGGVVSGHDVNAIEGQIFSMNDIDPALDGKMRLVNNVSGRKSLLMSLGATAYQDRLSTKSVGQTFILKCSASTASATWPTP